ncbi:ABC transporter ATP-binding protein [Caloranaerobacter ferrireducens]|uniref:ABC transporter ATP-binding protein n=1 Tax=Caloranaerobacter ferrireducens TaxID=1323370 RepID=UPI00084CEC3D|nr:ABC transporter ATP-binding protein [Caloranaerobacter ferrireducens]
MKTAIEVESLYFSYGDSLVLRDINFKIEKGEFVSIIGPNGSGKSTLLKNMISIYKPSRGLIKIDGKELGEYKAKELAKKVAIVPQDTNIAYDFSVFDVVMMGRNPYLGRFQKESYKDFQIVKDSLKLTDTLHLKDKSINQISGGERQRVIIARALAQQPEIILLDEPTSHLDINHQLEILSLLKKLNTEKNMTIVIVIHDINLATRYSNKMILLNKGEILSIGKPKEVITYENIEAAYNLNVVITKDLYTNSPYLMPLTPKNKVQTNILDKKVHVICGGGTGVEIISKLDSLGYQVSLGVINIGDTDWELGRKLSLEIVEELPFTAIGDKAFEKNLEAIDKSDVVILCNVPYGSGNLKNLLAAYKGLKDGKTIYLFNNNNEYDNFDYVGGKAVKILENMKQIGLKVFNDFDELIKQL